MKLDHLSLGELKILETESVLGYHIMGLRPPKALEFQRIAVIKTFKQMGENLVYGCTVVAKEWLYTHYLAPGCLHIALDEFVEAILANTPKVTDH